MKTACRENGCGISTRVKSIFFDNGLRVYVIPNRSVPAVTLEAWVETGSMHEGEYLGCGLSHFLEHMAFAGTARYPGSGISDTVNRLGGDLNAYTTLDHTMYYMNLPSGHWRTGLEMLDEMLRFPLYPEERFLLEKDVILRECDMRDDSPDSMLFEKLWHTVYPHHPAGHSVIGYRDKIATVNREMMLKYYERRYAPGRVFYVVAGDVDPVEVFDFLKDSAGTWPVGRVDEPAFSEEPGQCGKREKKLFFHDPLCRVGIAWRIPGLSHPDLPALDLLSLILGDGASSRLYRALKIESALALDINSFAYGNCVLGASGLLASAKPQNLRKLHSGIRKILDDLRARPVTAEELSRARTMQAASHIRAMRTNKGLARTVGSSVLACGAPDMADLYLERLSKVTEEEILSVAQRYFSEERMCVTELHPQETAPRASRSRARKKDARPLPVLKRFSGDQKAVYLKDDRLPLVDFSIVLPAALIWESSYPAGISRLLAECLDTGCRDYAETEFNDLLENNAIDLNVSSGNNAMTLKMSCTADRVQIAADAMASMLSAPLFAPDAVERERNNLEDRIRTSSSRPLNCALDVFSHELFGSHPYAFSYALPLESVHLLTEEMLREFYFEHVLIPSRCCVAVSGAVKEKEAFALAGKILSRIPWNSGRKKGGAQLPVPPKFQPGRRRKDVFLKREQSVAVAGIPSFAFSSPDETVLSILHSLSNNMSSNLFRTVREDSGLAYYTALRCMAGFDAGTLVYYAGTEASAVDRVLDLFDAEMKRLASGGMTQQEFDAAKDGTLFSMADSAQDVSTLALSSALDEFLGVGCLKHWLDEEKIRKMTLKDANRSFKKLFTSKTLLQVTVTPGDEK